MAARGIPNISANQEDWTRNDMFHNSFLVAPDAFIEAAAKSSESNGLPNIAVSLAQGKFLMLVAQSLGARRILEIGTLGGYSTIWLARALPGDGDLITLEVSEKHAAVANKNIENAGFSSKVKIIIGPAADSLATLEPNPPFDFIFIDADSESNVKYFTEAKRLLRKGGVIIVDNMVQHGRVADKNHIGERAEGVRNLLRAIKDDNEVDATTIATVGQKGFDGFLYAIRK